MYTSSGRHNCKRPAKLASCKNVKTQHCMCCAFDATVYEQRFWIDDSSLLREPRHECARQGQRLDTAQKSGQNNLNPKTSEAETVKQSALKSNTFPTAHTDHTPMICTEDLPWVGPRDHEPIHMGASKPEVDQRPPAKQTAAAKRVEVKASRQIPETQRPATRTDRAENQ